VLVEEAAHRSDGKGRLDIRLFSACRNERLRLPAFLKHYRQLGVSRFFFVDNHSSDGTAEYLSDQPDVRVFRTAGRFGEAHEGTDWLNAVLAEFGVGGWCVTVDVDELLVYPGSEQTPLPALTAYLERRGYEALFCMLIDLYPGGPLSHSSYNAGDDPVAAAPYFDVGPYRRTPFASCPGVLVRGGMRERIFYPEFRARGFAAKIFDTLLYRVVLRTPPLRDNRWLLARRRPSPPCLTKVPLVRWDAETKYLHCTHWISRKRVAIETGALLHMKFLHDFHARALEERARGEHYEGATEYRRYAERLDRNPDLTLVYEGSARFEGTAQLVSLGLMQDTDDWSAARQRPSV
jgi:hypothetical protein